MVEGAYQIGSSIADLASSTTWRGPTSSIPARAAHLQDGRRAGLKEQCGPGELRPRVRLDNGRRNIETRLQHGVSRTVRFKQSRRRPSNREKERAQRADSRGPARSPWAPSSHDTKVVGPRATINAGLRWGGPLRGYGGVGTLVSAGSVWPDRPGRVILRAARRSVASPRFGTRSIPRRPRTCSVEKRRRIGRRATSVGAEDRAEKGNYGTLWHNPPGAGVWRHGQPKKYPRGQVRDGRLGRHHGERRVAAGGGRT